MKKIKYHQHNNPLLVIKSLLIIAVTVCLTSCLKDRPGTEDYSQSPALVSFQYKGFNQVATIASVLGTPQDSTTIEVTLSVASLTLNSAVTLTLTPYSAGLDSFNNAQSPATTYHQLDPSLYTVQNGGKITISPGQQIVPVKISLAGDKIDFTQQQGIGILISDAQGAKIASNLNTAIILVKLTSIYAGTYTGTGARVRYNGGTEGSGILDSFAVTGNIPFQTVNATTISGQLGDAGSGYTMALQIVNTGTPPYLVKVLSDPATVGSGGSPSSIAQGTSRGTSSYDPSTKTFTLHFGYLNGSGALRQVNEVLTLQ